MGRKKKEIKVDEEKLAKMSKFKKLKFFDDYNQLFHY